MADEQNDPTSEQSPPLKKLKQNDKEDNKKSETSDSSETAQIALDLEERDPADAQVIGAHSPSVNEQTTSTPSPPGRQERILRAKAAKQSPEVEAELSTTNSSESWTEEVDKSGDCNSGLDHKADASELLDKTFKDYSSDSDIDDTPKVALKLLTTKPYKFKDFGIGRRRGRRPLAPVTNFVSWACAVCGTKQDTKFTIDDIESSMLLQKARQKISQAQRDNLGNQGDNQGSSRIASGDRDGRPPVSVTSDANSQENISFNTPSDGDGRTPVSVTPDINISQQEDTYQENTQKDSPEDIQEDTQKDTQEDIQEDTQQDNIQQNEDARDGMPPVPDVKITCHDEELQDETPIFLKDAHVDTQDEQQEDSSRMSSSKKNAHSLPTAPQTDDFGENLHANNGNDENSPKNLEFLDTSQTISDSHERAPEPEWAHQREHGKLDFRHTFRGTPYSCENAPQSEIIIQQKAGNIGVNSPPFHKYLSVMPCERLPSSQESGSFLNPLSNAETKNSDGKENKLMEQNMLENFRSDMLSEEKRGFFDSQTSENKYDLMNFCAIENQKLRQSCENPKNFSDLEKYFFPQICNGKETTSKFEQLFQHNEEDRRKNLINLEKLRTIDTDPLPNPNRQVANITSYIIKGADNNTKRLQQLNNATNIFGEKPETIETWESDYEKAKITVDSAFAELFNAANEAAAIATASFDEAINEDEPMETNQIAVRVTTPEKHQQNSDMEQTRETLEKDKQPELGRKLNIQIPVDEDRIARCILEEKLKVDKAAAERTAYIKKKKDERAQFKERTRKLEKRRNLIKTSFEIQRQ
ncbi:hypothetical protein JTB14_035611 [Gonioctena quinquepunctata]|nr:hypothetical protein JTB14_035611 [Gonioctena quinquepunctata]